MVPKLFSQPPHSWKQQIRYPSDRQADISYRCRSPKWQLQLEIHHFGGSSRSLNMFKHVRPNPDVAPHLQSSWSSSSASSSSCLNHSQDRKRSGLLPAAATQPRSCAIRRCLSAERQPRVTLRNGRSDARCGDRRSKFAVANSNSLSGNPLVVNHGGCREFPPSIGTMLFWDV